MAQAVADRRRDSVLNHDRPRHLIWDYDKRRAVMPLFMCRKCGCVENTALGDYWLQNLQAHKARKPLEALCSACLPGRTWHGEFDRKSADG
jgi:hypothetical protein